MSEQGVIIAGAAETDEIGKLPGHSTLGLHIEAARNAVADAGLTMKDIDGIATVSAPGPVQVAHALGIYPDWIDGTGIGGTSFLLHVRHAAAAIRAGYASTVLITHGESGRSHVGVGPRGLNTESPGGPGLRHAIAADPDERGHERQRVGRHVREQRSSRHAVASEPTLLVHRLPVGLEEEVADQVADEEDVEDRDPAHALFIGCCFAFALVFGIGLGFGFARSTLNL